MPSPSPPLATVFLLSLLSPCIIRLVLPQMLMSIVNNAVSILNNLEQLTPVLVDLGQRHKGYKVCIDALVKQ